MHEKSSYDCLQVTLSAYDLAVSSSTPIQRLSEGPKLPLTVITPLAVASGTCTSAGLAPIDDDAGCTKAAAALSYVITGGWKGGNDDVPRGCTVRSGSQLFRNTQAAPSQNAPCSARNVCICQRPAATTPLAVITPTPSRLGKCQGDCYADSQCQAGLRCFQRELCKHSPSAGDCASNDSGSQGTPPPLCPYVSAFKPHSLFYRVVSLRRCVLHTY